jgi:hypothetical protein
MPDFDLFTFFRSALFLFLGVYSLLLLLSTIGRLHALLSGSDARKQMLRVYLSYQVLTIHVKPFAGELAQIAGWLIVLGMLWWLHRLV